MIKDSISMVGLFYIAMVALMLLFTAQREGINHDAVVSAMVTSGQVSTMQGLDNSARTTSDAVFISTNQFEEQFEKTFASNMNVAIDISNISYDYFQDNGDIKAVKIIVSSQDGQDYTTYLRQNFHELE